MYGRGAGITNFKSLSHFLAHTKLLSSSLKFSHLLNISDTEAFCYFSWEIHTTVVPIISGYLIPFQKIYKRNIKIASTTNTPNIPEWQNCQKTLKRNNCKAEVDIPAQSGQHKTEKVQGISKWINARAAWRRCWHTAPGSGHCCRKHFSPKPPLYFKSFYVWIKEKNNFNIFSGLLLLSPNSASAGAIAELS